MRPSYESFADEPELLRLIGKLAARTVIFDVEPMVAVWNGQQEALDRGIIRVLCQMTGIPTVLVVCFATNSDRRPSAIDDYAGIRVSYLASARKPLRIAPYLDYPRPGMLAGDQVLTDGLLAKRLGYTFLHYRTPLRGMPAGPLLMRGFGSIARPFLFARSD
jgi:hypothetical protein